MTDEFWIAVIVRCWVPQTRFDDYGHVYMWRDPEKWMEDRPFTALTFPA